MMREFFIDVHYKSASGYHRLYSFILEEEGEKEIVEAVKEFIVAERIVITYVRPRDAIEKLWIKEIRK